MKNSKTIGVRISNEDFENINSFCKTNNTTITKIIRNIIISLPNNEICKTWDMLIAIDKFNEQTKNEITFRMLNDIVKQLYNRLPKENKEEK